MRGDKMCAGGEIYEGTRCAGEARCVRVGKPEAKLRLYRCGKVEPRLDFSALRLMCRF